MSPALDAGGLSVHVRRADERHLVEPGTAGPVVLVHGTLDRGAGMARVGRALRLRDVARYDRRGWGRSSGLEPAADLDVHVADLLAVARLIAPDEPVTVLGHSMGAVVGLAAAARSPEVVAEVVAYEPPTPWLPWWPRTAPGNRAWAAGGERGDGGEAVEVFLRSMLGDDAWEALSPAVREARRGEGPALMADLASLGGAAPFDASAIAVPVVVAHGEEADAWHRRAVEELAAVLPSAELAVVAGAGHLATATHPAELAALVDRCGP